MAHMVQALERHRGCCNVCLPSAPAQGDCDIKYIDPTYMIRAIPTTTNDRVYCKVLGQGAVHGAFAGELCALHHPTG